jgi:hypothetical protein
MQVFLSFQVQKFLYVNGEIGISAARFEENIK